MNISYYGVTSTIIPLPLNVFIKMVEDSHKVDYIFEPRHLKHFFKPSNELAIAADSKTEWYQGITCEALNWLSHVNGNGAIGTITPKLSRLQ